MTAAVVVLGATVLVQWAVIAFLLRHHLTVTDRHTAERDAWARERYDLNLRIQAPQVAPLIPPPSPTGFGPGEPLPDGAEPEAAEVDESDLVGTIA